MSARVSQGPLGGYLPGTSVLHRMRPGAKFIGMFVIAAIAIALRSPLSASIALALGITLTLISGLRVRALARSTLRFLIIGVPLFVFQAWQQGPAQGYAVVATLFALLLIASAFTASTAVNDTVETITWALRPFARFGVNPELVALAFSLVIRAIPTTIGIATTTREAAKARGLERNPRALLVPFIVRTVAHAQATGEALHARGIGD